MDPLSLTVATITLLQAATSVVQICYAYRTGLKNAPKDLRRITEEVISLRDVLEGLVKVSERAESTDTLDGGDGKDGAGAMSHLPTLKSLLKPYGPRDQCNTELEALQEKLTAPTTGWKATGFGKAVLRLKWPMTEQDVWNTLTNIERLKTNFSLALNTDQTWDLDLLNVIYADNYHRTIALATQRNVTSLTRSFSLYTQGKKVYGLISFGRQYADCLTALLKMNTNRRFISG
jgi:hypothetical protein